MTAEPVLSIRNLSVSLPPGSDRPHAVKNVSFDLQQGEILCVVGESGSGKSVTAQAIMGLLPGNLRTDEGAILFGGNDILKASGSERRDITGRQIAMIFQEPTAALNPVFRVGDLVAETFRIHTNLGASEIRQKVLDLFREVRLPEPEQIYNNYPHQLSGGQCQRVMIATALALQPKVLIADEPTTALDVTTQAQILKLLLDLRREHGTSIIFITHDFGVVAEVADRVAVMRYGEVMEIGTHTQVLQNPQNDYTKRLIAAVPKLAAGAPRDITGSLVLEATNIRKTFKSGGNWFQRGRSVHAVNDVSVTLRRGETLGLVGESGSGKSTLAQCIIRLIDPNSGEINIEGVRFSDLGKAALRKARAKIQIVFQDPYSALDPRQKIGEAIAEGPVIHGMKESEARARARSLLADVGLDPEAFDRYPHEFSGGQRQRICIARALALDPLLLIADEAVSALDVSIQAQILELLARLQKERAFAMLFITHDLRVASEICDRIAVMRHGKIVEEAVPADLLLHPQQDYTRELLAAVPGAHHRPQA